MTVNDFFCNLNSFPLFVSLFPFWRVFSFYLPFVTIFLYFSCFFVFICDFCCFRRFYWKTCDVFANFYRILMCDVFCRFCQTFVVLFNFYEVHNSFLFFFRWPFLWFPLIFFVYFFYSEFAGFFPINCFCLSPPFCFSHSSIFY